MQRRATNSETTEQPRIRDKPSTQRSTTLLRMDRLLLTFFFSSRRRHTRSVSAFLLNRSSDLTKMQLDNQKEIAEMQNETQKEIAGIQSATSRQNTKDQVYAQNEMLAYQQKESTARVASIMENTNLSKQQQVSEIMRQML